MITMRKIAGLAAALSVGVALAGCVTLLPKTAPVQLYRFGASDAATTAPSAASPILVMHGANSFPTAAAGDRILTVKGEEAAYIASGRWVSAATVLFDEAETRAFETAGAPVRLIPRGHAASAPLSLRLDVQTFEVRYAPRSRAPKVVVSVTAELTRPGDRELVAAKTFEVAKPASENRVGAIVAAFNEATSDVLGQVVSWTATRGGGELAGGR